MFYKKEQIVQVSLSEQRNVVKTEDKEIIQFDNDLGNHRISELSFRNIYIPVYTLAFELTCGRCLGQIYHGVTSYKRQKGFTFKDKWKGSCWIGVDIDDADVTMETMHNSLIMTPTFSMTTQSHKKNGHKNRYRLFYFFNVLMENYDGFCKIADKIVDDVRRVLAEHGECNAPIDDISRDRSRFFFGNPNFVALEYSWMIYEPLDFEPSYVNEPTVQQPTLKSTIVKHEKEEKVLRPKVWGRLRMDCLDSQMEFEEIVNNFRRYYHIRFQTKVDYQATDKAYIIPPKDFIRLRFRWINKPKINGNKPKSEVKKWHNHEHRRRILKAQLELIVYMNNFELTIDQLVFHAIYLFHFAYCNEELNGKTCQGEEYITPKAVMDIAREVYQESKEDMEELIVAEIKKDECAFMVNRSEAEKRGITLSQLLGEARRQYHVHQWREWVNILMPHIEKGASNRNLAKILENKTGVKRSPDTIGEHVKGFRTYRRKNAKNTKYRLGKGKKNAQNCEKMGSNTQKWIELSQEEQKIPIESSKDNINNREPILSKIPQTAVANDARYMDAQRKFDSFVRLYNPSKTDKENKAKIVKSLRISDRTYYKYKKEAKLTTKM